MNTRKHKRKSPFAKIFGFGILIIALYLLISHLGGIDGIRNILNGSDFSDIEDQNIREAFIEISKTNPEASEYLDNYEGITDYDLSLDLSDEIVCGSIPYYKQWDNRCEL